jgi:hypothetical protein
MTEITTPSKLKIVVTLPASELVPLPVPNGSPRVVLRVKLPDRTLTADIAAKSLRKVQVTIRELGAENVACILQGSLVAGDVVAEAGLSGQPKTPKAPAPQFDQSRKYEAL